MAATVPAGLTRSELRRFGLTVGGSFVALAAVAYWRGHATVAIALATVGMALVVAGVAVPGHLGSVHRAWMRLADLISSVTTPIIMGLLYFVVLTPAGWLRRSVAHSPMRHASGSTTFWVVRDETKRRSDLTHQF